LNVTTLDVQRTRDSAPVCQARLTGSLALLATASSLSGCAGGVLSPAGPVDTGDRIILFDALAIMLAIVIPTIVATLTFAWWYRASNQRARYLPDWAYSGRLELIVWSIPALVVFFLGGIAWIGSRDLDPARALPSRNPPLEVDVVSLDWKWLFIYPQQQVASVNSLVVPAGVPLELKLTSASVLNVFFVPQLGSQIYTMYGMLSHLNLEAAHPGVYHGLAAHFNGDGFPGMDFAVHAVAPTEFTGWVASTRTEGPSLDEAAYRMLLRQTQDVKPYTYSSVEPGLFDQIVHQKLPPGDGPQTGPSAAGSLTRE
jgi:cytochrome o ubiquinol oxidase subunit II